MLRGSEVTMLSTDDLNRVLPVSSRKIFFLLWTKYPRLLYVNYMENAELLAEWLGIEPLEYEVDYTNTDIRTLDGYSINKLHLLTGMSPYQVLTTIFELQAQLRRRESDRFRAAHIADIHKAMLLGVSDAP